MIRRAAIELGILALVAAGLIALVKNLEMLAEAAQAQAGEVR